MVTSSNTEVRGGKPTSPMAVGRVMAVEDPTRLGRTEKSVRGDMVTSPTAATATSVEAHGSNVTSPTAGVDMEVVARAGATASLIAGGSRARTNRARPGALRMPGQPPGPFAVEKTTRARTAMSGRAAAQQEQPALTPGRLLLLPRARETEPP